MILILERYFMLWGFIRVRPTKSNELLSYPTWAWHVRFSKTSDVHV